MFFKNKFMELPCTGIYPALFSNSFKAKLYANLLSVFDDPDNAAEILSRHLKEFKKNYSDSRNFILKNYTINLPDNYKAEILANGGLIAAFHLGNFLTLPVVISNFFNRPVNLLISKTNNGNLDFYMDSIKRSEASGINSKLNIITTDKKSGLLTLLRSIKNKEIALIYVDDVSSIDDQSEKTTPINFLNTRIMTRQGIGFLASRLKMPVFVSTSVREGMINKIVVEKRLETSQSDIENDFAEFNQNIFNILEGYVRNCPWLWFKWDSLHRLKVPDTSSTNRMIFSVPELKENRSYRLLPEKIFAFQQNGKFFCVTVIDLKIIPVDKNVINLLKKFNRPRDTEFVIKNINSKYVQLWNLLYNKNCFA